MLGVNSMNVKHLNENVDRHAMKAISTIHRQLDTNEPVVHDLIVQLLRLMRNSDSVCKRVLKISKIAHFRKKPVNIYPKTKIKLPNVGEEFPESEPEDDVAMKAPSLWLLNVFHLLYQTHSAAPLVVLKRSAAAQTL